MSSIVADRAIYPEQRCTNTKRGEREIGATLSEYFVRVEYRTLHILAGKSITEVVADYVKSSHTHPWKFAVRVKEDTEQYLSLVWYLVLKGQRDVHCFALSLRARPFMVRS